MNLEIQKTAPIGIYKVTLILKDDSDDDSVTSDYKFIIIIMDKLET